MFNFGILVSPYGGIILKDMHYLICDMGIGHKRSSKMLCSFLLRCNFERRINYWDCVD
jgi:hypothetical protein